MNNDAPFYGDQIQGARDYQEDSFRIEVFGDEALFLLCDGMGGHVGGKQASSLAVHEFIEGFSQHRDSPLHERLEAGLKSSNAAIKQKVALSGELKGMGTTLVAVYLAADSIQWVSVGDSPLWLVRDNTIQRLNADHSMAAVFNKLVKLGEITAQDAANDPKRHALLSSVSGDEIKHMDLRDSPYKLQNGDCLLLASDGIESLSEQDIISLVSSNDKPQAKVEKLLSAVKTCNKPQQDNATVIIYCHGQSPSNVSDLTFSKSSLFSSTLVKAVLVTTLLGGVILALLTLGMK